MSQSIIMVHQDIVETLAMVAATGDDIKLQDFQGREFTVASLE